ncbi:MAG: response regulator transcription factor [Chloroflexota bacterium]|nr:response regulator transcription factor [Chloroflexota bacterium]
MRNKKRILVVEDHTITRHGITNYLLSAYPNLEIEEARNGREAVDRIAEETPDVIIMDMVMPRMDGARATREIKAGWPSVKIVLMLLDPKQGQLALESGADAYLLKDGDPGELLGVLEEMEFSQT